MRIQKFLSHCGFCSRREAERLIRQGKVTVNGKKIGIPYIIDPENDIVEVDGKPIRKKNYIYIKYYKPRGILSSMKDPYGKKDLSKIFSAIKDKIYHIGRLDKNSEGLLLLTNDGEYANKILHPSNKLKKHYYVEAEGKYKISDIKKLAKEGIYISGKKTLPAMIKILEKEEKRVKLDIIIKEGKKRQIRRMLKSIGLKVTKLKRYKIGNITLGNLKQGEFVFLSSKEAYKIF